MWKYYLLRERDQKKKKKTLKKLSPLTHIVHGFQEQYTSNLSARFLWYLSNKWYSTKAHSDRQPTPNTSCRQANCNDLSTQMTWRSKPRALEGTIIQRTSAPGKKVISFVHVIPCFASRRPRVPRRQIMIKRQLGVTWTWAERRQNSLSYGPESALG